jgi:cell division septation protein DedD
MRERSKGRLQQSPVVWATLVGVAVVAGVFAAGFVVGKRAARLEAPAAAGLDPIAQLDAERLAHDNLTFYSQLPAKAPKEVPREMAGIPAPERATPAPLPAVPLPKPEGASAPVKLDVAVPASAAPKSTAPPPTPAPPTPAAAPAPVLAALQAGPAARGDYTVQVSSFQTREEASAFSASLERKGFKPFVVSAELPSKGTWYRVRVGKFSSEEQARQAKGVLARADIPAWVLRAD